MLEFNPKKRYSVEKILKMSYFDDIRKPALEKKAPYEIFLGCDQFVQVEGMCASKMRKILLVEIAS